MRRLLVQAITVGTLAVLVGITPANLAVLKNGRAKAIRFTTPITNAHK